jgi:hypothetical protein
MSPEKSQFINLAISGKGAKLSTSAGAERSQVAMNLAAQNEGYVSPKGYVNPLAEDIDQRMGPQPVGKGGRTEAWTQKNLHSGFEMLKANLTRDLEGQAPPIHPGHELVGEMMQRAGTPVTIATKAGFMPAEFTSSEYGEGKKFEDVGRDFTAPNHRNFKVFSQRVDREIAKLAHSDHIPEQHDAFGDFEGGAEASLYTDHHKSIPYDLTKAGASLKALHQGQLASLVFESHAHGPDLLHHIESDLSPQEVRDQLSKHGIANRTILADTASNEGTRVKLFDPEGAITGNVDRFISDPASRVTGNTLERGRGEFIGDQSFSSRDKARDDYRRILEEVPEGRPDQDWSRYNDLAASADRHYQEIKGSKAAWMPGEAEGERKRSADYIPRSRAHFMPGTPERVDPDRVVQKRASDHLVWVPADALDERWGNNLYNQGLYLSKGGGPNQIEGRYERASKYLEGTGKINAPEVSVWDDGSAHFIDGRHTFASMRDKGYTHVPVALDKESLDNARATGLTGKAQFMPGRVEEGKLGQEILNAPDEKSEQNPGAWSRYGSRERTPITIQTGEQKPYYDPVEKAYFLPSADAIPVTYKANGDPEKISYAITKAPLIAGKLPDKVAKDAPDRFAGVAQFDYLNPTQRKKLTALDDSSAVTTFADKLTTMLRGWLKDPSLEGAKDWYNNTRPKLRDAFGSKVKLFTEFLGATSPKQNPAVNLLHAIEAFDLNDAGAYKRHIDLYTKALDLMAKGEGELGRHLIEQGILKDMPESDAKALAHYVEHHEILPRRPNQSQYGINSGAVLKVLAGTWKGGPKTRQFAANLLGTSDAATIDDWAIRTMREIGYKGFQDQWRIQPQSKLGVDDLDFGFSQLVFDQAAKNVGLKPQEAQALAWVAERQHWMNEGWMKGLDPEEDFATPFSQIFPEGRPRLSTEEARRLITLGAK